MRLCFALAISFFSSSFFCQAAPISFPAGYVPFDFWDYVTSPNHNGYSLVMGETAEPGALVVLISYLRSLPAVSGNEQYANQPIELAPGRFFSNVIVPTDAERQGDFSAFGPIDNPRTSMPFPGSIIPQFVFGRLFAFRLGSGDSVPAVPEPGGFLPVALGLAVIVIRLRPCRRS